MGHQKPENYAGKHPGKSIDPVLKPTLEKASENGRLNCAAAHRIAKNNGCTPEAIGIQADLLELRISTCQLGLFGYAGGLKNLNPDISVPDSTREKILAHQADGCLSCRESWDLATALGLSRPDMGSICEKLEIRIKPCQLGAF